MNGSQNLRGSLWLLADLSLNIWALSIVKAMGADYPSAQIVFLRVCTGLVVIAPWIWRARASFGGVGNAALHGLRVALSAVTLVASFYAIARVPFATFTAINFLRPILLMLFAALLLREVIPKARWAVAGVALAGALIAVAPGQVTFGWGFLSLCLAITTGTLAIVLTRRLKGTPEVVMMTYYTIGIAVLLSPLAAVAWVPVDKDHWPILLAVGVFAQAAQLCFLRAHWQAEASVLASVSYLSIVLSTAVGFFVFAEVPGLPLIIGATLIIAANMALAKTGATGR